MAFDPPYSTGIFETIVDVHFGNLYLVVMLRGSSQSFVLGVDGPAPSVTAPLLSSFKNAGTPGVRLLDTVKPKGGANISGGGFIGCYVWTSEAPGDTPHDSWRRHPGATFAATNNSCPWPGGGDPEPTVPCNFEQFAVTTTFYLYAVPAGNELVSLTVSGVAPYIDSGIDADNTQTITQGDGTIDVSVFSRVRGTVKKVSDLIDFDNGGGFDGRPRPTEDDRYTVGVTNDNQGKFTVNVHLDKNKASVQTDNYGKTFAPYKVATTPALGVDHIPSQPPPRLG